MSPLFFALYLNDLQDFLALAYDGLGTAGDFIEEFVQDSDIVVYLKLFTILYADDTVIFAENRNELQAAMNAMYHYCELWKLDINEQKTKVVVYGSKSSYTEPNLMIGKHSINFVSEYTYLGVCFPCNGNFVNSICKLKNQASRAMFALLTKARKLGLDIDVQMQLFDSMVVPIATYGCEIWGFKNITMLEKLHLQFCKYILRLNRGTPTVMVLGELGRFPIEHIISCKMLGFWYRLLTGHNNKISSIMYKLVINLEKRGIYTFEWIRHIKNILTNCELEHLWHEPGDVLRMSFMQFKALYKKQLRRYYVNKWLLSLNDYSKCSLYRNFKTDLVMEAYLIELKDPYRTMLLKFRTSNHMLPIEKGRHLDIDRNERKCELCDINDIGDEYHYVCCCTKFYNMRKKLIPNKFFKKPSTQNFCDLMSSTSKKQRLKTAKFINYIMREFRK